MNRTMRTAVAGFFHETHTFVEEITGLDDFRIARGDALLEKAGDGSTLDGFLEVAANRGWDVVPIVDFTALPSGTMDHAVFAALQAELEAGLKKALSEGPLDGVWLSLHGAAVTTECEDPEGELLAMLRSIPSLESVPVFGVFDLHATFTPEMAEHANGLIAYRENPHSDAREVAVLSAELLDRALSECVTPVMVVRNAPIMWPPSGTGTADSPMRELEALARSIEAENPEIWAVSVVAGFSFSDVFHAGVSFCAVVAGDSARAAAPLERLARLADSLKEAGLPRELDLETALEQAARAQGGPVLIVEPADNIGGGAPGDCTAVLRAMLRQGTKNAVVTIADAEAIEALRDAEPGEKRNVHLGGKGSSLDEGPLDIVVEIVRHTDGRFELEDRQSHLAASQGGAFDMGPSTVVTIDGRITVLITSRKTPPFDLGQLRSQGIEPESAAVIGVKAAVAHRRAYDPIAHASFTVSSAGPCASDLASLPYRRIRRPVFPLDRA